MCLLIENGKKNFQTSEFIKNPGLKNKWSTAYTELAYKWIWMKAEQLGKRLPDIKVSEIPAIQKGDLRVGWDEANIIKAGKGTHLFSREFGPCIAILMRTFQSNDIQPSFLSLNHVFLKPIHFAITLKQLVKKIEMVGRIEIFISGGNASSKKDYIFICNIIKKFKDTYPDVVFEVKDDTFGIAEMENIEFKVANNTGDKSLLVVGVSGINCVGIDKEDNPYQLLDFRWRTFDNS